MNDLHGDHRRPGKVDTTRLATWASGYSIHTLERVGEDRLVLRGTNFVLGTAIAFFVGGALILLGWAQTNTLDEAKAIDARATIGGLLLILGCGVWLAPQRVVFDRRRGQVSRRYWLFRFSYSWNHIVGVQIIYGGRHQSSDEPDYETREINLVLNSSDAPRVNLTNHADHATTRSMATEISRFLMVPLWDEYEQEIKGHATEQEASISPVPKLVKSLRLLAGLCIVVGLVAGFSCVVLSLQQAKFDALEAELKPVRARLIATEVKEWIEGHDNWYAMGNFEIESGDHRGRAEGNLIPQSFYEARGLNRPGSYDSIPRAEAAKFLTGWEIGKIYDGYIWPDAKDRIFFELPGAESNALNVRRLGYTSGILLTLGLVASCYVAYVTRRQKEDSVDKTVSTKTRKMTRKSSGNG
jgi:hypothetical protein